MKKVIKDKKILEKNLDMLLDEYKLGEEIGGKYFSYMYACINYTFIFYGAAFVAFQCLVDNPNRVEIPISIFMYLLPISTYVLGLFYMYNSAVIFRQGFFMTKIEKDIFFLNSKLNFPRYIHCWNILSKKLSCRFILAYGTMLVFYIILPFASLLFGVYVIDGSLVNKCFVKLMVYIIPIVLFIIYVIFVTMLIVQMFKFKKLYNLELEGCKLQYENEIEKVYNINVS